MLCFEDIRFRDVLRGPLHGPADRRRDRAQQRVGPRLRSMMAAVLVAFGATGATDAVADPAGPAALNLELAYFKALNEAGPPQDPQIIVLLMQEYQNSNRRAEGVAHFGELMARYDGALTPPQEVTYLASLGILRAEMAGQVPMVRRAAWVGDTIEILDRARAMGGETAFYPRFATGLIYSQLPALFGKAGQARTDLEWLVENRANAPQPGLMRAVYTALARLYQADGRAEDAAALMALVGNAAGLTTNFSVSPEVGGALHPTQFTTIEPDRVYLVTGAEFTEYHFIVSADGRELISVDAGTTPALAEKAYGIFKQNVPDAPPLTTVFITHAHWDHVGGHRFFRELNPDVTFYGRANYHEQIAVMAASPETPESWFFSADFDLNLIDDYHPDVEIDTPREVTIGGTRFELIPAPGAETLDAMFVHMPEDELLFVGDFIMPFIGAPFVEEGDVDELIAAIDMIGALEPRLLLHGHQPLTANVPTAERLLRLKPHVVWLRDEAMARIRAGVSRADILQENLIPPTIFQDPLSQVFFLALRENIINRLYDQNVGYWEADLTGLDHLGPAEYGAALSRYFDLDDSQIEDAIEAMLAAGDYHLAERIVRWALALRPDQERLQDLQQQAALRLRGKYQAYNPFKFILYSELADTPTPQLPAIDLPVLQN